MYEARQNKEKVSRRIDGGGIRLMEKKQEDSKNRNQRYDRNRPIQMFVTEPQSVASDMLGYLKVCFRKESIYDYFQFRNWKFRKHGFAVNGRDIINRIRPNTHSFPIRVNYKQKENRQLPKGQDLINWLQDGKREHMWVNVNKQINIASRDREKPHPTLFGGDPDAQGAGLMSLSENIITVNNSSGHFRPNEVDADTLIQVSKSSPKGYIVKAKTI